MPSVTAVRTFSISAGLAASTLTPGSTAPDVSLTDPAMTACASAADGSTAIQDSDAETDKTAHTHLTFDKSNNDVQDLGFARPD